MASPGSNKTPQNEYLKDDREVETDWISALQQKQDRSASSDTTVNTPWRQFRSPPPAEGRCC